MFAVCTDGLRTARHTSSFSRQGPFGNAVGSFLPSRIDQRRRLGSSGAEAACGRRSAGAGVSEASAPCARNAGSKTTLTFAKRTWPPSTRPRKSLPRALERKVYCQGSRFPETPTTSLGVLQPWPLPSSRLVSPRNQAAMVTIPPSSAPLETLLQRVREHYREMPGLQLTKPQASRLFGVAPSVCAAMLRALVMENFLSRAGDGLFVRSTTY